MVSFRESDNITLCLFRKCCIIPSTPLGRLKKMTNRLIYCWGQVALLDVPSSLLYYVCNCKAFTNYCRVLTYIHCSYCKIDFDTGWGGGGGVSKPRGEVLIFLASRVNNKYKGAHTSFQSWFLPFMCRIVGHQFLCTLYPNPLIYRCHITYIEKSYVCTVCYALQTITKSPLDNLYNIFRQRDAFYVFWIHVYPRRREKKFETLRAKYRN